MRARKILRRFADLSRLFLAVGLLVLLWFGTVRIVERASEASDDRRLADWELVADALAAEADEWFASGRTEAEGIASRGANQGTIDAYLAAPRAFGQSVLVIDGRGVVVAASPDRFGVLGRTPSTCTQPGEDGAPIEETGFRELLDAGRAGPSTSGILLVPGECRTPSVAAAAPAGNNVVVVIADATRSASELAADPLLTGEEREGGARLFLIDPAGRAVQRSGSPETTAVRDSMPSRIASFVSGLSGAGNGRYGFGEDSDTEVIGVFAPLEIGWGLVLEQDAALFDVVDPRSSATNQIAAVLVLTFAAVFFVLAFFEARRRRAHRRAEVAKNAFFSVAGHELRTPLTSIKGFMETLAARWDDVGDEQKKMIFDRMLPQVRRLDRLIDRLLVAASIQSETYTHPQVATVEVTEILEGVADEYRESAPLHTFVVKVQKELPPVQGDPNAIRQILTHLVDNAVKYSPSGGRVGISARTIRGKVEITVFDEGVGLPSDVNRMFEPLVQGEDVTKRVHDEGGMGVGLYIVRTLVGEMGGSVRAEPREPTGARFVVTLKRALSRDSVSVG